MAQPIARQFSRGALLLGADSPITPYIINFRKVDEEGIPTPNTTPQERTIIAAIRATEGEGVGWTLGLGEIPTTSTWTADLAPEETSITALGSDHVYTPKDDAGGELSVSKIAKKVKSKQFFGYISEEKPNEATLNAIHLCKWFDMLQATVRVDLPTDLYGGNFMDYMWDPELNPEMIPGLSYFPSSQETWTAFTATRQTVERFETRKAVIRQHITDILRCFTTKYWVESMDAAETLDGQDILKNMIANFYQDSQLSVNDRAKELTNKKFRINGKENPNLKLSEIITEWTAIIGTGFGAVFSNVHWVNQLLYQTIQYNENYKSFRETRATEVLNAETAQQSMGLILSHWSAHSAEWPSDTAPRMKNAVNQSRAGTIDPDILKRMKCYNCDKLGHLAADCRQPKRGAQTTKGGKGGAGKGGGGKQRRRPWDKAPCQYSQCHQDNRNHAATDCPDKIANDRKSRQGKVHTSRHTSKHDGESNKSRRVTVTDDITSGHGSSRRSSRSRNRDRASSPFPPPPSSTSGESPSTS